MATRNKSLILLAFLAFVSLGLPDTLLGVAWPSVRSTFGQAIDAVGWLLAFQTAGYLSSSFFGGSLLRRIAVGPLLAGSCAVVAVALAIYATTPVWPALYVAALFGGVGAGAIDAGINAFGAKTFSPRVMNWLHACWGIGATLGPLAMTAVIVNGLGWRVGYGGLAAVMAGLALLFALTSPMWRRGGTTTDVNADEASIVPATFAEAVRSRPVQGQTLFYFLYGGVEFGTGVWLFTLLRDGRGVDAATAGTVASAFWAALTIGRVVFGQLAATVNAATILRVGLAGAVVGIALIWDGLPTPVTFAGALLAGFSLAPVYPTTMSVTPRRVGPRFASHSVGFQVSAAASGIAVFPWLMGVVIRSHGVEVLPPILLALAIVLFLLGEALARLPRPTSETRAPGPSVGYT